MDNIDNNIIGIVLGIDGNSLEIPKEFRDFLEIDNQGIEGLDFMLSDDRLSKKIPPKVRLQYEVLYANLSLQLDRNIEELKRMIDEIEKNPKDVIHDFIDKALSSDAEE